MGRDSRGGAGDEIHAEGGIHRGGLAGFEVGEAFDVIIETLADLVDGGFGHECSRFLTAKTQRREVFRYECTRITRCVRAIVGRVGGEVMVNPGTQWA